MYIYCNMIIKKETKNGVTIYTVEKDFDDAKMLTKMAKKLHRSQIKDIIDSDADVYAADGTLLLRFRKNKLTTTKIDAFYENVIKFAHNVSANRGIASGSTNKNLLDNPKVMSNILGYFDTFSPSQKILLRNTGVTLTIRETRFNAEYPEKFQQLVPLIKEIDAYYKQYIPDKYKLQRAKANETPFKIDGTAFTTVTTNVNYHTAVHQDKGDDTDGFGNLAVIEHGEYTGGETCFPQYGIGVDVRTGDVLYMNVHEPHGNLPIKLLSKDAKRLSIVCYLRTNIWKMTRGKSEAFKKRHLDTLRNAFRKNPQNNKTKKVRSTKNQKGGFGFGWF